MLNPQTSGWEQNGSNKKEKIIIKNRPPESFADLPGQFALILTELKKKDFLIALTDASVKLFLVTLASHTQT